MKKITSLFLAFVMVALLAVPALPVFAADETTNYFRVSQTTATENNTNVEYAKINDAITNAADGATIYLLADYDFGTSNFSISGKTLTIDGSLGQDTANGVRGFTFKNASTGYCTISGGADVTMQNMEWSMLNGFNVNGGTLTFDNTYVYVNRRPFAKSSGTNDAAADVSTYVTNVITVKDSVVENDSPTTDGQNTILFEHNSHGTVNVVNSTLSNTGLIGSSDGNNSIMQLACRGNAVVNVDATSTIAVAQTGAYAAANATDRTGYAFCFTTAHLTGDHTFTVNLAAGATLKCDSSAMTGKQGFAYGVGDNRISYNDNGAKYVVGAKVAAGTSIIMPEIADKKFVAGSTAVVGGGTYIKAAEQTAELVFTMADMDALTNDAEAIASGMFFRVGDVADKAYFPGFNTAVDAAEEGDTIYLLANGYTMSAAKVITTKNLTLDGQGFTMAATAGYALDIRATGFKLYNITWDATNQGISASPSKDDTAFLLTIENATFTSANGVLLNYSHNRNGTASAECVAKLVVKDSTLQCDGANSEDVILLNNNVKFDVEITNSTLEVLDSKSSNTTWGRVICSAATANTSTVTINNSKLTTAYDEKAEILYGRDCFTYVLNDVDFEINSAANTDATPFFINGACKVIDNGSTYKASPSVLAKALVLPTPANEGETLLGYSANGKLYGTAVTVADAAEAMTFEAVSFTDDQFDIVDGASIRKATPYGIRFTANIDKALYDQLVAADANVEFGMVIGAKRYIFGENFFTNLDDQKAENYAKVVCENLNDATVNEVAVKQMVAAVYINGDENLESAGKTQFETTMTACAYITIHFADGTTQTIWAAYDATANSRSLFDVAKAYYEDATITDGSNKNNEVINKILTACGYTLAA